MSERDDKTWITTFTKRKFWPLDPRPEDVDILDIAHGLSMKCRFQGQCPRFYSVAQHSVGAARMISTSTPQLRLRTLLHDAAEAYMPDVPGPIKHAKLGGDASEYNIFETLIDMESKLLKAIEQQLGLGDNALLVPNDLCKTADRVMLSMELAEFFDTPAVHDRIRELTKGNTFGIQTIFTQRQGHYVVRADWAPTQAKTEFLLEFATLKSMMAC